VKVGQALAQGPDGLSKTELGGNIFVLWVLPPLHGQLLFQRQQFGNGHGQERPVEFRQQALIISAAEFAATKSLLQSTKFNFNSPSHFVKLDNLLVRKTGGIQDAREDPDLGLANAHEYQA